MPDPLTLLVGLILGDDPASEGLIRFGPDFAMNYKSVFGDDNVPFLTVDPDGWGITLDADGWGIFLPNVLYPADQATINVLNGAKDNQRNMIRFDYNNGLLLANNQIEINAAAPYVTIWCPTLYAPNLPTSDPADEGAIWNDGGTLKVSAG